MQSPCCQALHVSHCTMNSPASGSSSPYESFLSPPREKEGSVGEHVPVLPHTQRVIPCSSSSGGSAGRSSLETIDFALEIVDSWTGSSGAGCLSFSLPLRFARPFAFACLAAEPLDELLWSSTECSISSCLRRLLRPLLLLFVDKDGRDGFSLGCGADSGCGDLEVLVEADGAERLPERRGSLGDNGGPMVAVCAITDTSDERWSSARCRFGPLFVCRGLLVLSPNLTSVDVGLQGTFV
jgi:hypothetical protein